MIAQGVKVEGDFTSQGNVTIEGQVSGHVSAAGDLLIGEQARIDADVAAANAIVSGSVKGNIRVEDRLELTPTSRVEGDVEARVLQVASGAIVNGRVTMTAGPDARAVTEDES